MRCAKPELPVLHIAAFTALPLWIKVLLLSLVLIFVDIAIPVSVHISSAFQSLTGLLIEGSSSTISVTSIGLNSYTICEERLLATLPCGTASCPYPLIYWNTTSSAFCILLKQRHSYSYCTGFRTASPHRRRSSLAIISCENLFSNRVCVIHMPFVLTTRTLSNTYFDACR